MPAGSYVLRLLTSRTAAERSGLDKGRFTRVMQVGAQKSKDLAFPCFTLLFAPYARDYSLFGSPPSPPLSTILCFARVFCLLISVDNDFTVGNPYGDLFLISSIQSKR